MKVSSYECPVCSEAAWGGETIATGEGVPTIEHLQLHCPTDGHPNWAVDVKCSACGLVPSYTYHMSDDGSKRIPNLACCGGILGFNEREIENPFLDERAI